MSWLTKLLPPRSSASRAAPSNLPEGLWSKCPSCEAVLYATDLEKTTCTGLPQKCGHHNRLDARQRLDPAA